MHVVSRSVLCFIIVLRLGGGLRPGNAGWPAEAFTTLKRATHAANDLLGRAAEQEVFQPRP
jgi:hypothetical protein